MSALAGEIDPKGVTVDKLFLVSEATRPGKVANGLGPVALADGLSLNDCSLPAVALEANILTGESSHAANPSPEVSREKEVYKLWRNPDTYEVAIESDVTLEDYKSLTDPDDWLKLTGWAEEFAGKIVVFFNPTMEGGGVAMMRPPLVHLLNQLGVEAHWYVMAPIQDESRGNPFDFTKQIHNVSQRKSQELISEAGKALHHFWAVEENGEVLLKQATIRNADIMFIDDPQPAPLIKPLKAVSLNPNMKVVWRNHIDTDGKLMADPTTPQGRVATYILDQCGVRSADAIVTHPVPEFMHHGMEDKTYFAPATFDHFDNLNRHLSAAEVIDGINFINHEIAFKNAELASAGRSDDIQPLLSLDPNRKRLTLIARFDPSKGMEKAIKMGAQTRQLMRANGVPEFELPEVVIVGNGSVDDPDGPSMYEKILGIRREQYPEEAHAIIIVRLKHNYDALNALMTRSSILMQTSDAEGLETRVSDGIKHGLPAVVSNRGGIKTQVVEGQSGIILDYDKPDHDLPRGAAYMARMLTNPDDYQTLVSTTKEQARSFNLREFATPANAARLLRIFNRLNEAKPPPADKTWKMSTF